MYQIARSPEIRPIPHWGRLQRSLRSLAAWGGGNPLAKNYTPLGPSGLGLRPSAIFVKVILNATGVRFLKHAVEAVALA